MKTNSIDSTSLHFDIVLIGGGIAGLWLLNYLVNQGYNAVLFEREKLGSQQTIASQGMIHGGVKYTLAGALSGSSEQIADMPVHWKRCLKGEGDIDLSDTRILSECFYMWSSEKALSKITTFFASKALRGRINHLKPPQFPEVFQHSEFRGQLYQLVDLVIDTPSLLKNLLNNVASRVYKIDWDSAALNTDNGITRLSLNTQSQPINVCAQQFLLTAGAGNQSLLDALGATQPEMQTRPLRQVIVKHNNPYYLYAHCIGTDSTPRITISSHPCSNNESSNGKNSDDRVCWYLGGQLSEHGVHQSDEELIATAQQELLQLFPWLDWQDAQWSIHFIERAEPMQHNFARPDKAFIDIVRDPEGNPLSNAMVAWPTKLTLCPNLAHETLQLLQAQNVHPQQQYNSDADLLGCLDKPEIAAPPWFEN